MNKISLNTRYFPVCKGQSNDDVGVARDTVFQEIRLGAGFKASDFVHEKLRGLLPSVAQLKREAEFVHRIPLLVGLPCFFFAIHALWERL